MRVPHKLRLYKLLGRVVCPRNESGKERVSLDLYKLYGVGSVDWGCPLPARLETLFPLVYSHSHNNEDNVGLKQEQFLSSL